MLSDIFKASDLFTKKTITTSKCKFIILMIKYRYGFFFSVLPEKMNIGFLFGNLKFTLVTVKEVGGYNYEGRLLDI